MRRVLLLLILIVVLLLGMPALNRARGWLGDTLSGSRGVPAATAVRAPLVSVYPSITVIPVPSPAAARTATPSPVPLASSPVSRQEAEGMVHDYFSAFDTESYDRLRSLTSGQARQATDAIIERLQQEERSRGVRADIRITRQEIVGVTASGPDGVAVDTSFAADIYAGVGPLQIKAGSLSGRSTFVVQRVEGATRITEISGDLR